MPTESESGGLVVDASLLVAALTDTGKQGRWAEGALSAGLLAAPHLVLVEVANVLRRLELSRQWTSDQTTAAYEDLLQLDIELFPFLPVAGRVWELRQNLTAYDAWYVALAESLDVPLATLDRRLTRASGPTCKFRVFDG